MNNSDYALKTKRRVVDNRVFLLGLDELYREAMKAHERSELLNCARETAQALFVPPADVPVEGYYSEDGHLAEYFRLIRALQGVDAIRERELTDCPGFRRLEVVTQSGLFGRAQEGQSLLPTCVDSLTVAMESTRPNWSIETLTVAAWEVAMSSDDYALVTLGALAKDPVVLAALRESSVLYAACVATGPPRDDPEYVYVWAVDDRVRIRSERFIETFNAVLGDSLPKAIPENAKLFWIACKEGKLVGRCVRIGFNYSVEPISHYHWAIHYDARSNLTVEDFWDTRIWTTAQYAERPHWRVGKPSR